MEPRQKGDLYRKKRMLYFDSVERRGELNDEYFRLIDDYFAAYGETEQGEVVDVPGNTISVPINPTIVDAAIKKLIEEQRGSGKSVSALERLAAQNKEAAEETAKEDAQEASDDAYKRLRALLYRQEACYYYGRYIVYGTPIDEILYETIPTIIRWDVPRLDGRELLKDIEGFTEDEDVFESRREKKDVLSLEQLLKDAENVKAYISGHLFIFDAQCLLSVTTETEGLSGAVRLAEEVSSGFDILTAQSGFAFPKKDINEKILEPWLLTETAARIGQKVLSFVREYMDFDIEAATDALREMLPQLSYSMRQKDLRKTLGMVILERSGQNAF